MNTKQKLIALFGPDYKRVLRKEFKKWKRS